MITSTIDRARAEGIEKGIEKGRDAERRRLVLTLLQRRFSPLPPEVVRFVETCPADRLADLPVRIIDAAAIEDLHLTD